MSSSTLLQSIQVMCGIAGTLSFTGEPPDLDRLHRMISTIAHRGPDGIGVIGDGPVGLAHARLSIIDLEGGQQPMATDDGRLTLIFNGEIFNYIELRDALMRKGHRFRTLSDTEVLLRLYEEEGDRCVERLNGQWAFAVWDKRRRRLFLSRDRLGVRPLFYAVRNGLLLFASECKAILSTNVVEPSLDLHALVQVLTCWCPIPPRTLFVDIKELPPGCSLTVQAGTVSVRRYWHLDYGQVDDSLTEGECIERLRALLLDATRIRLRSDVPVGTYLSGGLDSSIVASLATQVSAGPLRTFSVAFEQPEFDERRYQRQVAEHLAASHEETCCSRDEIARVFPDTIWHAERPVLRTAPAPLFVLARLVRARGYKVVLTGEGADELFGGYDIFKEVKIRQFWARAPHSRRRPLLLRRLYPYLPHFQSQPTAYLEAFFKPYPQDLKNPLFSHLPRWLLSARVRTFLSDDVKAAVADYDPCAEIRAALPADFDRWDVLQRAQYLETAYLLPGYILSSQGDRMAMAHGVEARFPFLDHRIVEFAATLPSRLKLRVLNEKYILKRAFANDVPAFVRTRPKQPYRAPDAASFFSSANRQPEYVGELLGPGRLRDTGLFSPNAVQRLVSKVRGGLAIGAKDNMAFMAVLATQLLHAQFIPVGRSPYASFGTLVSSGLPRTS